MLNQEQVFHVLNMQSKTRDAVKSSDLIVKEQRNAPQWERCIKSDCLFRQVSQSVSRFQHMHNVRIAQTLQMISLISDIIYLAKNSWVF